MNPWSRELLLLLGLGVVGALCGCDSSPAPGPPDLHPGRDTCAECGMIISEARFASAITIEVEGAPEYRLFDDIGDMLSFESSHPQLHVIARYVHDLQGQPGLDWLDAESATYLAAESFKTPMGSGIVAFADLSRCQAAVADSGAHPMKFSELRSLPAR